MDEATKWQRAHDADGEISGSEVAETTYRFAKRSSSIVPHCGEGTRIPSLRSAPFTASCQESRSHANYHSL